MLSLSALARPQFTCTGPKERTRKWRQTRRMPEISIYMLQRAGKLTSVYNIELYTMLNDSPYSNTSVYAALENTTAKIISNEALEGDVLFQLYQKYMFIYIFHREKQVLKKDRGLVPVLHF